MEAYVASESEEMRQAKAQAKALLEDRDDIKAFRPGRDGNVMAITFKKGRQPPGMIRAHRKLSKDEVRPAARGKESKPFRDFLATVKVTENCQSFIMDRLGLPAYVSGSHTLSHTGMACYSSRTGHVGADVIVEVPVGDGEDAKPFKPHADMEEIKPWQYIKACEEAEGYKHEDRCYCLEARMA